MRIPGPGTGTVTKKYHNHIHTYIPYIRNIFLFIKRVLPTRWHGTSLQSSHPALLPAGASAKYYPPGTCDVCASRSRHPCTFLNFSDIRSTYDVWSSRFREQRRCACACADYDDAWAWWCAFLNGSKDAGQNARSKRRWRLRCERGCEDRIHK